MKKSAIAPALISLASDRRPEAWVRRVHGLCRISLAVGGVLALLVAG
jgi:hypothetical protein